MRGKGHDVRALNSSGRIVGYRCSRLCLILSIFALMLTCVSLVSCTLIEGWIGGLSNNSPHAFFTASPSSDSAPLVVRFNASESSDPDGDAIRYLWDFGDGTSASGVSVVHTYGESQSGRTLTVVLTVTDEHDATAEMDVSITLPAISRMPPPPPF